MFFSFSEVKTFFFIQKKNLYFYQHSGAVKTGKKKSWKSLKQIATSERTMAISDAPTCVYKLSNQMFLLLFTFPFIEFM